MALNDEREKLDLAQEYLLTRKLGSQEFEAALEHLRWTYYNAETWRPRCELILRLVAQERKEPDIVKVLLEGLS